MRNEIRLSRLKDTSVTIREKITKERPNITAVSSISEKQNIQDMSSFHKNLVL